MFYDEIIKKIDIQTFPNFLGLMLGFKGISLQGKFVVNYYSKIKIVLSFSKQKLYIYGQNLNLKNMDKNEIVVVGEIIAVCSREVQIG